MSRKISLGIYLSPGERLASITGCLPAIISIFFELIIFGQQYLYLTALFEKEFKISTTEILSDTNFSFERLS